MSNVVNLTERLREYTLNFRCPNAFSMNTENSRCIVKLEVAQGEGTATVKARSLTEAKRELHKVIAVTEWL